MESIKLSSTTDRYTITSQSATPALFFMTIGRPPFTAIGVDGPCTKYNHQINKEKDPNATNTQT